LPVDIEPLHKILELECEKGYSDSAVFGGLDKFLQRWSGQTVGSITDPQLLSRFQKLRLVNSNYASLTGEQRQQWVSSVLSFLAEFEHGKAQAAAAKSSRVVGKKSFKKQPIVASKSLDLPVTGIKGVSSSVASKLKKLGVETVRDLLYFFPHRHLDYSQMKSISQLSEVGEQTIMANVWQARVTMLGGRRSTEAIVGDETGNVRAVWFNNPYLAKTLTTNARIVLSGRVSLFRGRYVFESPEWELVEDKELIHTGRMVISWALCI